MHHPAGSLAADETNFALGMEEESDAGEREEGNGDELLDSWSKTERWLACLLLHASTASFKPHDRDPTLASCEHFVRSDSAHAVIRFLVGFYASRIPPNFFPP
jgi:hypothetical protein